MHRFFVALLILGGALTTRTALAPDPPPPLPFPIPEAIRPYLAPERFHVDSEDGVELTPIVDRALLQGGKRIRPLLCYLSGGLAGVGPERLAPLACIAEWAHGASLMHDDVIDGSPERRGRPSLWRLTSVKKAVLLGDWLLARLVRLALRTAPDSADGILKVIQGMVEGEFLQDSLLTQGRYDEADWERVAFLKTGLLFQWATRSPAVVAGLPEGIVDRFEAFGRKLALIFQKRDDLEDADERGEINAVLLRAAGRAGGSPLAAEFPATAISAARGEVAAELRVELGEWKESLRRLANEIASRNGSAAYAEQCLQSLLIIGDALSP